MIGKAPEWGNWKELLAGGLTDLSVQCNFPDGRCIFTIKMRKGGRKR